MDFLRVFPLIVTVESGGDPEPIRRLPSPAIGEGPPLECLFFVAVLKPHLDAYGPLNAVRAGSAVRIQHRGRDLLSVLGSLDVVREKLDGHGQNADRRWELEGPRWRNGTAYLTADSGPRFGLRAAVNLHFPLDYVP